MKADELTLVASFFSLQVARHLSFCVMSACLKQTHSCWNKSMNRSRWAYLSCHIFLTWGCQPFAFVCHECMRKTKPCLLEWKYEREPMSLP